MRSNYKQIILIVALMLAAAGIAWYFIAGRTPDKAAAPRVPVQIVKTAVAESRSVPIKVSANGYVTALNTVAVRPQVQNIVRSIHVREGQEVEAGQLLFTLDERTDRTNVSRTQAEAASTRAELAEAETALKRNEELAGKGFVSKAVVDTARSKVLALRNTLEASQAATRGTSIALGNNRITASIAGRIGAISVFPGSLATPAGDPMVTIAQMNPITVSFSLPERELGNIVATYPKGDAPVTAQLPGSKEVQGKLIFIDNAADTATGTIKMKALFDNPERRMWPGSYVNVSLVSRSIADAVTVPTQAVVTGPTDKFVYVVQPDSTVKNQPVEVLAIEQGRAAISGLAAGARVVVEGSQNLRPGGKVKEATAEPGPAAANGGPAAGPQKSRPAP